jgi:DNA-binding NtrC family response regulator
MSRHGTLDTGAFMNNADPQTTSVWVPDGATLLVVDRNPFFRRALQRTLELEGISVVEAGDGEQALRVIEGDEAQLLDVVLTSLLLPVVSAPELIAVLLECRPELPVVAMSGLGELPADLPPVPLLRKPFDHEELVRMVAPLVLSSQAMRRQELQAPADAAELRSLAERQRAVARDQVAKSGDLMIALMQLRRRLSLQLSPGSLPICHEPK